MHRKGFHKKLITSLILCTTLIFSSFFQGNCRAEESLVQISDSLFQEKNLGRVWQVQRSKKIKTTQDAIAYINQLNQGEFNNWRLPTKHELKNLFNIFDFKDNGNVMIRLEGSYWLAENHGAPYVGTFEIGDQCGPSRTFYNGKTGYVRAVRP
ncbi:Lcl domain-containing protein [Desulforhopalus sp. 52FAK]